MVAIHLNGEVRTMRLRQWIPRATVVAAALMSVVVLGLVLGVTYLSIELHALVASVSRLSTQVAALERVDKKLDALQGMDHKLQAVNGQLSTTNALLRVTAEKITHAKLLF